MAVPYHTHTFEIPAATPADVEAGTRDDVAVTPSVLGTAATKDVSYFATAAQGGSADTAVQSVNGKTGTSVTLDKTDIGMSNVDNTSDLSKPISSATQSALDLKANIASLGSAAYTAATDYATAAQGTTAETAVQSVNGKTGTAITLAKSDVGLGNVDNTSDANKPISTATQTALNGKATTAQGAKADTALQAPGGSTGQVLTKNSGTDNDVSWQTVAAATAVSYGPQSLNSAQQQQARDNISAQQAGAILEALRLASGPAANQLPYMTSATAAAFTTLTAFARSILDDANGAAVWATMGARGGSGYFRLPSGHTVQYGNNVVTLNANGNGNINFPQSFSATPTIVIPVNGDTDSTSQTFSGLFGDTNASGTYFAVRPNPGAVTVRVFWIAIGMITT